MNMELRADGLHITGYVNVPGRYSRPVTTPHGRVIEVIEQRAFDRAIKRAKEIRVLMDHNKDRVLASTKDQTLKVKEDEIGLRADTVITDEEVINAAKDNKIRGWSFNMKNVVDEVEERSENLPLRKVKDFDMDEITLAIHRVPVYAATSVEIRAGEEENEEHRAISQDITFCDRSEKKEYNSGLKKKLEELKKEDNNNE